MAHIGLTACKAFAYSSKVLAAQLLAALEASVAVHS